MKLLPEDVKPYKRTPEFSQDTLPAGLRKRHMTSEGVWGRIVVLEGALRYRILEPESEELLLGPEREGIVAPGVPHEVEPMGDVRFYVEFLRATAESRRIDPQ
jgi:tellurite resistance-related uncharacterized protein